MIHVFRLMGLSWLALAIQWMSAGEWLHAVITAAVGAGCYALGEHYYGRKAA